MSDVRQELRQRGHSQSHRPTAGVRAARPVRQCQRALAMPLLGLRARVKPLVQLNVRNRIEVPPLCRELCRC